MSKHTGEIQQLLSSELTDDEFNTQMAALMQKHMVEMQDLMPHQPMN
jgi:hypothetical protein